MTRHFKMLSLDYTAGKESVEPIKQVMKLNSRGTGRRCGMESGAEETTGEVILRKSESLADIKGTLVCPCGIVVQLPRKK